MSCLLYTSHLMQKKPFPMGRISRTPSITPYPVTSIIPLEGVFHDPLAHPIQPAFPTDAAITAAVDMGCSICTLTAGAGLPAVQVLPPGPIKGIARGRALQKQWVREIAKGQEALWEATVP